MITLMESINPMIREIAIEDFGHPYFVYTDEHVDLFKDDKYFSFSTEETSLIVPGNVGTMGNRSNQFIASFNSFQELIEFVASTDDIAVTYRKPLLAQLVKSI